MSFFHKITFAVFCIICLGIGTVWGQKVELKGSILGKINREPIVGCELKLYDHTNQLLQEDKLGKNEHSFAFKLFMNSNYYILVHKDGYQDERINVFTEDAKDLPFQRQIIITMGTDVKTLLFTGLLVDRDNKRIVPNAVLELINTMSGERVYTASDGSGRYSFNIRQGYEYELIASRNDYLKRRLRINYCPKNLGQNFDFCMSGFSSIGLLASNKDKSMGDGFESEVFVDKIELNKTFPVLGLVFYDFNQSDLRPEAEITIGKLVDILKDNPQISIEFGTHTDSRGSDAYNLELSQKRAQSVVKYIHSKGIAPKRVVAHGYGETQLLNHCSNGVSCPEELHQENRRLEFKIVGISEKID